MGLNIDENVLARLESGAGFQAYPLYKSSPKIIRNQVPVNKDETQRWGDVINTNQYRAPLNGQENTEAIIQYLLLNFALRKLQLSLETVHLLKESIALAEKKVQEIHIQDGNETSDELMFQYAVYDMNEKLRFLLDNLIVKDKNKRIQNVRVQIVPETGDIYFLSKPLKETHENTGWLNTPRAFRRLKSSQSATPIISSWQITSRAIIKRLRESLLLFSIPVQHINKAFFRHARLPCYKHAYLIEILVPECGLYRRSYALTENIYADEPKLIPLDGDPKEFYKINTLIDPEEESGQEVINLDFDCHKNITWVVKSHSGCTPANHGVSQIEMEPVERCNPLEFYIRFYCWVFHSFHFMHHPFAMDVKKAPSPVDRLKLVSVFQDNYDNLQVLNTIAVPKTALADNSNEKKTTHELGHFIFYHQQQVESYQLSLSFYKDEFGKIELSDNPYIYQNHLLPLDCQVFGQEPLMWLREQDILTYNHYFIDKQIQTPLLDANDRRKMNETVIKDCLDTNNSLSLKAFIDKNKSMDNYEFDIPVRIQDHFDFQAPEWPTPEKRNHNIPTVLDFDQRITIHHCDFNEEFSISDYSHLPNLIFYRCQFKKGFDASNVKLNCSLVFIECRFDHLPVKHERNMEHSHSNTAVNFFNAKLGGELSFNRCLIAGRFQGAGLKVERSLRFRGTIIKEHIAEKSDPFSPKSFSMKKDLLDVETKRSLRSQKVDLSEVNPYYLEAIPFRTMVNGIFSHQISESISALYQQSNLLNILGSLIHDLQDVAKQELMALFPIYSMKTKLNERLLGIETIK